MKIIMNATYVALVAAENELAILKARIAQVQAMDSMLNDKELVPNGECFYDALCVLKHGPYGDVKLKSRSGDACFVFSKYAS